MKKINLKRISEVLTEKELKNIMGGSTEGSGGSSSKGTCSLGGGGYCSGSCPDVVLIDLFGTPKVIKRKCAIYTYEMGVYPYKFTETNCRCVE